MTRQQAIDLMVKELHRAEAKHPRWPADRLRQVVVMVEEAGEALQAALNIIEAEERMVAQSPPVTDADSYDITLAYNRMVRLEEELEKEVAQTAAMALRWLINRKPLYAQDQSEHRP